MLCLEFDGGPVDSDESFIVPNGRRIEVPVFDPAPYGVSDRGAAIVYVTERVRRHFKDTPLRVAVGCPTGEVETRVLVGGAPALVGEGHGIAGIAPFDVGNVSGEDIGFAFSDVLGTGRMDADLDLLADVIAHEAGHTFGLDHVQPRRDLMHPTLNDEMLGFLRSRTLVGDWQDAPALLTAALESDDGEDVVSRECDPENDDSGNDRERAADLLPDEAAGGHICAADEDWFAFEAEVGDEITLELSYPSESWVEPPALFRPRGRIPLGATYATDGVHHVELVAPTAGRYRVRIQSPDAASTRYTVQLELTASP